MDDEDDEDDKQNCPTTRTDPVAIVTVVLTVGGMVLFCAGYTAAALVSMACGAIGVTATHYRAKRRARRIDDRDRFA